MAQPIILSTWPRERYVRTTWRDILFPLVTLSAWMCGCTQPRGEDLYQRLQSESPPVRIQAALEAGERRDTRAVPLLVDRLSDSQSDVRFFAIEALRRITHQDLGYQSWDTPGNRQAAVERWYVWLGKRYGTPAPGAAPATQPAPTTTGPATQPEDKR